MTPDLEIRDHYKKPLLRKKNVKSGDVVLAATNIYQTEYGHWFEDEGWDSLWEEASTLFLKHRDQAKDLSELVDKIVADLHGDTPTVFEQVSEESAHGVQPASRNN